MLCKSLSSNILQSPMVFFFFFDCVAFYQCELLRDFPLLYKSVYWLTCWFWKDKMCLCVYTNASVCVWLYRLYSRGGVGCGWAGVEEKGVGCYLSFLSPIHVAFCWVLTNAFVVLPIVQFSCELYFLCAILISPTMPIKGNVFQRNALDTSNLFYSFFPLLPFVFLFDGKNKTHNHEPFLRILTGFFSFKKKKVFFFNSFTRGFCSLRTSIKWSRSSNV